MKNKSNKELLDELERVLIYISNKTEQNKRDEVDKLKAEILSRMKNCSRVKNKGFKITVEELEKKLSEVGMIAFHCNESFYAMYKAERECNFPVLEKIHSEDEKFLLHNDKVDKYYRISDTESLFYEGMVLINDVIRAIEDGIIEVIEDYKKPEITVYSIEELPTVAMN